MKILLTFTDVNRNRSWTSTHEMFATLAEAQEYVHKYCRMEARHYGRTVKGIAEVAA